MINGFMATGYCMKHKGVVEIVAPRNVVLKNKRNAIQGVCPQDGTKVTRILGIAAK